MSALGRYAAKLRPDWVEMLPASQAPHKPLVARNAAFRRGQLYEAWAGDRLEAQYGLECLRGPWLRYGTLNGQGFAQIDALVFDLTGGRIYVIETKIAHTRLAYLQLFHCYLPLLERALGRRGLFTLIPVEICSRFDAQEDTQIPCRKTSINDLRQAVPGHLNVLIWRKPDPFKDAGQGFALSSHAKRAPARDGFAGGEA